LETKERRWYYVIRIRVARRSSKECRRVGCDGDSGQGISRKKTLRIVGAIMAVSGIARLVAMARRRNEKKSKVEGKNRRQDRARLMCSVVNC
jgi:hypothetical protein